jgi:hypothetical protein
MFRLVNNSCLWALLLGSCSSVDSSKFDLKFKRVDETPVSGYRSIFEGVDSSVSLGSSSSRYPYYRGNNLVSSYLFSGVNDFNGQNTNGFNNFGPLELYANPETNIAGLKLPIPFAVEFSLKEEGYYKDYLNRRSSLGEQSNRSSDYWAFKEENNRGGNLDSGQVPLNALGKVLKKIFWDMELATPFRRATKELSGLSNTPTRFIFGAGAKSDLELKLGFNDVRLIYKVNFSQGLGMEIEGRFALSRNNEETIKLLFVAKF